MMLIIITATYEEQETAALGWITKKIISSKRINNKYQFKFSCSFICTPCQKINILAISDTIFLVVLLLENITAATETPEK